MSVPPQFIAALLTEAIDDAQQAIKDAGLPARIRFTMVDPSDVPAGVAPDHVRLAHAFKIEFYYAPEISGEQRQEARKLAFAAIHQKLRQASVNAPTLH